jgi:hypothetical protein
MDLEVSLGWLLSSLLVGTVGMGLFVYGKKQARFPQLFVGMAMMAYPYFVASTLWMLVIAGGLVVGLWLSTRA